MGSLGDGDNKTKPTKINSPVGFISDTEAQTLESQFSPSSLPGGKFKDEDADELQFLQSTMPFDGTFPLVDAFETQVVNLGGETQAFDHLDCVENFGTQLLDDCDTEVFVDTDDEGTERTEVLGNTEEFSDDDSVKSVGTCTVDHDNMLSTTLCKQGDGVLKVESNALSNEEFSSRSVPRGFTSVRAASIRACGLAARNMSLEGTNCGVCSIMCDSLSLKQHNAEYNGIHVTRDSSKSKEEIGQEHALGEYDVHMKGLRNDNKCSVGRSTVRKLFTEDTLAVIKGPNDNMNSVDGGGSLPQFDSENALAGLSYVDSQEPGESSQANALDFVDRFLKVNVVEFDQEVDIGKSTEGKSKPVSSATGTQRLAKRANLIGTVTEGGIFDWDDSCEDEGGGEFFQKKKEALFDNGGKKRRSFTQPRKPRCLDSKSGRLVEESRDKEEQMDIHDKLMGFVYSDSKLILHNSKGSDESTKVTEAKFRKNLINELDEEFIGSKDGIAGNGTDKYMPDMVNIGIDTQMAAEAKETLCFGVGGMDHDDNDANQGAKSMRKRFPKGQTRNGEKGACSSNAGVVTRQSKQTKRTGTKLSKGSSFSSLKHSMKARNQCDRVPMKAERKRAKSDAKATNGSENTNITEQRLEEKSLKRCDIDWIDRSHVTASSGQMVVNKQHMQEPLGTFTPIACRTRWCLSANQSKRDGDASSDFREGMTGFGALKDKRKRSRTGVDAFAKDIFAKVDSNQREQSDPKFSATTSAVKIDALDYPRRRTRQKVSSDQEVTGLSTARIKRPKTGSVITCVDLGIKRKTRSSVCAGPILPCLDRQSGERLLNKSEHKGSSEDTTINHSSVGMNGNTIANDVVEAQASKHSIGKSDADIPSPAEGAKATARLEASPRERCKQSSSACTTPVTCATPINEASPICMGDEYLKQSCRKNLSKSYLVKETKSLIATGQEPISAIKDSRRRRDMANVQVLFSRHLDGDTIKQQKKILVRLGASVASSISDATHFIADKFVRTRNMLEAIAFGKPVVTHLWLESCGQASCLIDERNYILRDAKKEKEFGFSLPVSLARACQHPLLQGHKVLITPNTRPGKEILASLVKAVHGVAVERIGRSALKDGKIADDLLVLSCEEDCAVCVPFLEKGTAVYSSELLLNGIVTQKLEYERHRLFGEHVKRTRSAIWLRKDSNQYHL